ncbi:MAG: hypothetical protein OEY38_22245 [Gammaproteobacteria bacterium]|nr:hypothetical protein [Gammaproteobacteria bacterium]
MFIIQLKFSNNKSLAGEYMDEHNRWIKSGFDDGVFLLIGSLHHNLGGGIIAHNLTQTELETRINTDPFVVHDIVQAEIIEITPAKTDERLQFLVDTTTIA